MRWLAGLALGLICGAAADARAQPGRADLARLAAHESYASAPAPPRWAPGASRPAPEPVLDLSVARDWAEDLDLSLTSYSGFGRSGQGAMLTLGRGGKTLDRLKAMGFDDGREFGDQGRWYLFAAASGRAIGLNLMREDDGLDHAGWSTDATSTLVSDAQLGLGWRKGDVQTSFGYLHREVKGRHMVMGQRTRSDQMVGLSLSVKPSQ